MTGFVLISRVPVSGIMVGLGAALVIAAAVVEVRVRGWRSAVVPAALVLLGGAAAAVVPSGCDAETIYHCAVVETDPDRASGGSCCWTVRRTHMSTLPTRPTSSTPTQRPWCR